MHPVGFLSFGWTAVHSYSLLDEEDAVEMIEYHDKYIIRSASRGRTNFENWGFGNASYVSAIQVQ